MYNEPNDIIRNIITKISKLKENAREHFREHIQSYLVDNEIISQTFLNKLFNIISKPISTLWGSEIRDTSNTMNTINKIPKDINENIHTHVIIWCTSDPMHYNRNSCILYYKEISD